MRNEFIDYYRILGIVYGSTDEQIENAYLRLTKRLNSNDYSSISKEREEELKIRIDYINKAYDILTDREKREQYDILYLAEMEKEKEKQRKREESRQPREVTVPAQQEIQVQQETETTVQETKSRETRERRNRTRSSNNNTFTKKVKKAYQEIKDEERNMSFNERHRRLDKVLNGDFTDGQGIMISVKNGVLHVGCEFLYHLNKFTYVNEDTVTKYIIRNRKNIAAIALVGAIISGGGQVIDAISPNSETTLPATIDIKEEENTLLTRLYRVHHGDTLSGLSSDSNTTINTLRKVNNLESNTIYAGQTIKVPYYVKESDLDYYVESVEVGEKSLYDIAKERETDVETLIRLNGESIIKSEYGTYVVISDTINVPKFITREELYNMKENNREYR